MVGHNLSQRTIHCIAAFPNCSYAALRDLTLSALCGKMPASDNYWLVNLVTLAVQTDGISLQLADSLMADQPSEAAVGSRTRLFAVCTQDE